MGGMQACMKSIRTRKSACMTPCEAWLIHHFLSNAREMTWDGVHCCTVRSFSEVTYSHLQDFYPLLTSFFTDEQA